MHRLLKLLAWYDTTRISLPKASTWPAVQQFCVHIIFLQGGPAYFSEYSCILLPNLSYVPLLGP